MAKNESQGLQIALILFVMLTVVLAVTTFMYYRQVAEAQKREDAAVAQKKSAEDARDAALYFNQYLKHILGAAPIPEAEFSQLLPSVLGDAEMAAIHAQYEKDMKTGEAKQRSYQTLFTNLLPEIQKLNSANTDLNTKNADLARERDDARTTEKARADLAESNYKTAKDEYDVNIKAETDKYNVAVTEKDAQLADFSKARADLTTQIAQNPKTISERDSNIRDLGNTIALQTKRIEELRDEPFESPDGQVTWVNQRSGTVWINLGLSDGLRRQTAFSVYQQDAMNVATHTGPAKAGEEETTSRRMVDERKGMIEVTRVIDQHLAEARIVEDFAADPILPGDQIFSPSWKPGRQTRFALVGFMDIDDDRRSDRDLIRNIITMNGGRIDAEVHDDGAVEGELSAETRYLVRGVQPDGSDPKVLAAYSTINGQADELGVPKIELQELLEQMGYKTEVRTVGLGKNADPQQFKPQPAEGSARKSTGNTSGVFKERRPPARSDNGAYK